MRLRLQFSVAGGGQPLVNVGHPGGAVVQHGGHVLLELWIAAHDPGERGGRQREQAAVRFGAHADRTPRARRGPQARLAEVTAVGQRGHHFLAAGHQNLDDALVYEVHFRGGRALAHDRVTCKNAAVARVVLLLL